MSKFNLQGILGGFKVNYIEIDFNKVKGFKRLTAEQQQLFIRIYKVHNSGQGLDYKDGYTPLSVKWDKNHLKVVFKNGIWLHYSQNETWY